MLAASRLQARYRRLRDAIGTGEIGLHCAIGKALKGFCALMRGECRGATETHATGLGALPAFACTGTNQLALKLGQATENREHQPAVRRCGIGPGVFEAAEVCFTLADCGQHIKQVACRACQPVEPGHQQHIARLKPANDLGELGTVSLCARYLFLEHFGCACSHQLYFLRAEILSVRADTRIAISRHYSYPLLKLICAL